MSETQGQDIASTSFSMTLANAVPQIVWTASPDGWLDYYNDHWVAYTGMSVEQTQGWGWAPVLHPDDVQRCVDVWKHSVDTGEPYEIEYRFRRASDGSYRWHLGRALPVRDAEGRILKWFGTCTDIQDQKDAIERTVKERAVIERSLALADANVRLQTEINERRALSEKLHSDAVRLNQIIDTQAELAKAGLELDAFFELVIARLGALTQAAGVVLEIIEGDELVYRAASGAAASQIGLRLRLDSSLSGLSATSGEVLHSRDTENDDRVNIDACRRIGIRSMLVAPLFHDDETLGVLKIMGAQPDAFDEGHLQTLQLMAGLLGAAIGHRVLTDKLAHQAQHDALTGLPNRLLFQDRLAQALAQAERKQQKVAVLYMDLDRFKNINDTLGHSVGDALLRLAADRLCACIRKSDTMARLGGDEFVVLVTELTDAQDAMRVASKLTQALRLPFQVDGHELFVSISLGISIYPTDGTDGETLMVNADVAMYRAKDRGRDNFQWFAPEMNALARNRMDMERQLRHALELGQLSMHYQPQYGGSGQIQGLEALMRWDHPTLGMVSPVQFIALAEDCGLIVPMGEWALRAACAQMVVWRGKHPSLRVAVNVSAIQFKRNDWVDTVRGALHDTGLDPSALELEITESLLLHSVTETSANLFELRTLGVGIAIDDFGTGYSSLSYLHKLPVTTLKIDKSFVHEIGKTSVPGQEEAPIIRTIIALAHNFGMSVVAEGVETETQRDLLLRLGCDSMQGYLFSRALTVEQVDLLLNS
jgi:diguanylate cyclase (GGDEF)-like protein/PAS domain S-box-containing protein